MVVVRVTEDDLYAAITELYNTGTVEWVAEDGTKIVLATPETEGSDPE